MKFKFCSGGDCPLWALAGLHALGSIPAALFRVLVQHVVEEHPDDGVMDILKDTSLSSRAECARAVAAIRWVLHQAWRCSCTSTHLTRDLLVLGLPRAHATALAEMADVARQNYVANAQTNGFSVNKLTDASISTGPEGTDTFKLTLFTDDSFTGEHNRRELIIDKAQITTLLGELRKVYQKMNSLEKD